MFNTTAMSYKTPFPVVDNVRRGCLGFFVCLFEGMFWRLRNALPSLIYLLLYTTENFANLKKSIEMETFIHNKAKAAEDQIEMSQHM